VSLRSAERVVLLACGTSWHAALVGKFLLEQVARVPAEVDYGSEFRYRTPIVGPGTVAVAVSQSGETADTLAAFREAKARGALPIAICNVQGSMLTREAGGSLLTHAGPEIGVASTKAFTAQLVALSLLALHLGRLKGTLSREDGRRHLAELTRVPHLMEQALAGEGAIENLTRSFMQARDFLYLGRGINYPIALEGALKLKEISYVHAEGYPAGEMKHGPIALIDESMPVVALCPKGRVYDKMLSNVQEVKARGGRVIAVVSAGDRHLRSLLDPALDAVLEVPACDELWSPFLMVLPLQLLAYHAAVRAGRDVDQPRNLAKSVTVE
jgi:glucosamine--fructose-6-phosphate aminotransferase (isomerizing)